MNQPDPARIEKILGTFRPKRKPAFEEIHPWRSLIEGLRDKGASYDDIAEILKQEGVQTSDTTVRKFCHKALMENKKSRLQRKLLAQTGKVTGGAPQFEGRDDRTPKGEPPTHPNPLPPTPTPRTPGPRVANVEFIEEPKI